MTQHMIRGSFSLLFLCLLNSGQSFSQHRSVSPSEKKRKEYK